jgi:hypothetical protein
MGYTLEETSGRLEAPSPVQLMMARGVRAERRGREAMEAREVSVVRWISPFRAWNWARRLGR